MLTERLPLARAASWQQAHSAYQHLGRLQGTIIDKLPLHHKDEMLAGLAESALRTGRDVETTGLPRPHDHREGRRR